jgi:hypothetical protein
MLMVYRMFGIALSREIAKVTEIAVVRDRTTRRHILAIAPPTHFMSQVFSGFDGLHHCLG